MNQIKTCIYYHNTYPKYGNIIYRNILVLKVIFIKPTGNISVICKMSTHFTWPSENQLNGIFGSSLFHNRISGHFLKIFMLFFLYCIFFSLFHPQFLWDISYGFQFSIFMQFQSVRKNGSLHLYLFHVHFLMFLLSYSNVLDFVLSSFILIL